MLRLVDLVRTDVSEGCIASIIRVTRIGKLGMTLAVNSNRCMLRSTLQFPVTANVVPSFPFLVTLMMEATRSSEESVLTTATQRNIPEERNPHSYRRVNLKFYTP
jgi:hypothetical protein